MADIELCNLVKIYPFLRVKGLFNRKQQRRLWEEQQSMPYTTNEGVVVLQNINAKIKSGEFVVLLGPSGCGKSTLLRLIAGLEQPTLGEVRFDGEDAAALPPEDRDVAMVFQNYSLYPHLTVYDNIAFPLRTAHMPRAELEQTVQSMARLLHMEPWLNRLPGSLSGGQLQRVAIARALVRRPRVFLMDEPFSNLDAPLRAELRQLVKQLHRELGITFLYVTHDHSEALSLGRRILVMRDGQLQQDGTPEQIYAHPVNRYVAGAVGNPAMNLYDGLTWADGGVELFGVRIPAPAPTRTVGIRPVNVLFAAEGIGARVEAVEDLGSEAVVHLTAGGQSIIAVWESAQASGLFRGRQVKLQFPREKLHYFDRDGNRIE